MALMVDPNMDAPGDDDESVHPNRAPVQTPGTSNKFFTMDTEEELYEKNKKLHTVLRKLKISCGCNTPSYYVPCKK